MKYAWLFLLVLAACSRAPQAAAPANPEITPEGRTRIGNGGDDNALRDNAWFVGEATLRVCLESETGSEKPILDEAFEIWSRYLSEKKLNEREFYPERGTLPLYARHTWVGCGESPDLRIVLGKTADAQLNWERLNEFAGKSAFVMRRAYDPVKAWGRGDMWISSSRLEARYQTEAGNRLWLLGHAVHELGHVLGCGHVNGTIMEETFFAAFEATFDKGAPENYKTAKDRADFFWPDQTAELLTCEHCPVRVTRSWTHTQWDAFDAMFGTEALNQVVPSYFIELSQPGRGVPFRLHFGADSGFDQTVSLTNQKLEETVRGDLPLFKVSFQEAEGRPLQSYASFQTALRYTGTLIGHGGEMGAEIPIPVEVIRNSERGAMVLVLPDRESLWMTGERTGPIPSKEIEHE